MKKEAKKKGKDNDPGSLETLERKRKNAVSKDISQEQEVESEVDDEQSEAENEIDELPSHSSHDRDEDALRDKKKLSAKEKLRQKLDKKKTSERGEARLLRHLSSQSSRVEDRLKEEDTDAQIAFDR